MAGPLMTEPGIKCLRFYRRSQADILLVHQTEILLDSIGRLSDVIHVKPTPCRRCIRARFTVAPRFFPISVVAVKLLAGANNRRNQTSFASPKDHHLLFSHPKPLLPLQQEKILQN